MKKNLFVMMAALAAVVFVACSKDDDGGRDGSVFRVEVPKGIIPTRSATVWLSVTCDTKPIVTFTTEGDALGVVSLTSKPEFDTEYVYADELIDVEFSNGTATAMFWYIPLTAGNHGVNFTIDYTQNGVAKTETSRHVLTVSDAFIGGLAPEIVHIEYDPAAYFYTFRNSSEDNKMITGCDFRIAYDFVDEKIEEITIENTYMVANEFYPIRPQYWDNSREIWRNLEILYILVRDEDDQYPTARASGPITFSLICRDDYNRCRDVVVKTDANGDIVSAEWSDYYLWRNRK